MVSSTITTTQETEGTPRLFPILRTMQLQHHLLLQYWDGDMFAEHLARAIMSETPHEPKRNLAFAQKVMNRTQPTKDRRTAKSTNGGTVKEAGPDTSSA